MRRFTLLGWHVGGVDLGALVEVDVEGIGQREAVRRLVEVDVEEFLDRAAIELLVMQATSRAQQLLRVDLAARYLCHTRTSSS